MMRCSFQTLDIKQYLHLTAFGPVSDHSSTEKEPFAYVCKAKQSVVYMTGAIYLQSICLN